MAISFPVKGIVYDNTLGRTNDPIGGVLKTPRQCFCVRIYKTSISIEPLTGFWIERSVGLEVVKLPWLDIWYKDAPDVAPSV
jgi:hypothetical protein